MLAAASRMPAHSPAGRMPAGAGVRAHGRPAPERGCLARMSLRPSNLQLLHVQLRVLGGGADLQRRQAVQQVAARRARP
jgi:hypothetical protein